MRIVGELHTTHPPRNPITFFEMMRQEIAMSIFKIGSCKNKCKKTTMGKNNAKERCVSFCYIETPLAWHVVC